MTVLSMLGYACLPKNIFFSEVSIWFLCPFLKIGLIVFLLDFENSVHILDTNSFPVI